MLAQFTMFEGLLLLQTMVRKSDWRWIIASTCCTDASGGTHERASDDDAESFICSCPSTGAGLERGSLISLSAEAGCCSRASCFKIKVFATNQTHANGCPGRLCKHTSEPSEAQHRGPLWRRSLGDPGQRRLPGVDEVQVTW